jgi:NAD(P)-dependent dehydrogenase (short-subunit alcohol dehydrogenase family)
VAARIERLDILINNAGIGRYDDLSAAAALEEHLAINLFGTYGVTQAFLPALEQAGGALVNNVSMMALAPFPVTPAYAISKAAAFNLTQSLRGLLGPRGISVHAVLTLPTDTDMTRGYEIPKATPESSSPSSSPRIRHSQRSPTCAAGGRGTSKQRITELTPGRRVVWRVLDSSLDFTDDPRGWVGSEIVFDIAHVADRTTVRFSHVGLTAEVKCYENCGRLGLLHQHQPEAAHHRWRWVAELDRGP